MTQTADLPTTDVEIDLEPTTGSKVVRMIKVSGPPMLVALAIIGLWYGLTYLVLDPSRRFRWQGSTG